MSSNVLYVKRHTSLSFVFLTVWLTTLCSCSRTCYHFDLMKVQLCFKSCLFAGFRSAIWWVFVITNDKIMICGNAGTTWVSICQQQFNIYIYNSSIHSCTCSMCKCIYVYWSSFIILVPEELNKYQMELLYLVFSFRTEVEVNVIRI